MRPDPQYLYTPAIEYMSLVARTLLLERYFDPRLMVSLWFFIQLGCWMCLYVCIKPSNASEGGNDN